MKNKYESKTKGDRFSCTLNYQIAENLFPFQYDKKHFYFCTIKYKIIRKRLKKELLKNRVTDER